MPVSERYRSPKDVPAVIPVFPLKGAILLPRATLPLNIFEPRYLAMFDDVIAGPRVLGVIQPDNTSAKEESPRERATPLKRIGCAARVTAFEELKDNRMVVTLTGICRFEVRREVTVAKPYRCLEVAYDTYADDFTPASGEDPVDRAHLLKVLKAYLELHKFRVDWRSITSAPSEALVNSLSVVGPYGAEEKQALLEAPDLKTRADVLIALAEMEIASGHGGAGSTLQ